MKRHFEKEESSTVVNALHVYELSRLVHASPVQWEKKLRDLEENKDRAYAYYQPAREAIVKLCVNPRIKNKIVAALEVRAKHVPHAKSQHPVQDNLRAFECFSARFLPQIQCYLRHYIRTEQSDGVLFEGIAVKGLPHLEVLDGDGNRRFVFLYPAAWEPKDLAAYLEILSFIIEAKFKVAGSTLWCMDLRRGTNIKHKSNPKLRKRCGDAARLFARLAKRP